MTINIHIFHKIEDHMISLHLQTNDASLIDVTWITK